jgi:hypothetical protein
MSHSKFSNLPDDERKVFIARLLHCFAGDDGLYQMGNLIIGLGERRGLFLNVSIGNEEVRNAIIERDSNVDV